MKNGKKMKGIEMLDLLNKLGAEVLLEVPDLAPERRLGHVQLLGRSGHVFEPGNRPEVCQLQQFHRLLLTDGSCRCGYRTM